MSVKPSIVKSLSNAVVKVSGVIKYFRNDTFKNNYHIVAMEIVPIQLLSLTVVSEQKIEMKTRNTMALSYHSKVTSIQNKGLPFFLAWLMKCRVKPKFFQEL